MRLQFGLFVFSVSLAMLGCGTSAPVVSKSKAEADSKKSLPHKQHREIAMLDTPADMSKLIDNNNNSSADNSKPWRDDPSLKGRFHPNFPDDLQVIVHDGGPRVTKNRPELMWVTVVGKSGRAYRGKVLNKPHNLTTVKHGEEILFLAPPKGVEPFRVTAKYLDERKRWYIMPCNKCGMPELFDAPSDLKAAIFPNLKNRANVVNMKFTSFCPLCGGVQIVSDEPLEP